MTITTWLSSENQDYKTALQLYEALPTCNRHFLKAMQKADTPQNLIKLRYQLEKNKNSDLPKELPEKKKALTLSNNIEPKSKPNFKPRVLITDLPLELHATYIEQKNNFAKACSLKMQLNALEEHEIEHKALGVILEIESLFKAINEAWKILDYYLEHKEVIQVPKTAIENLTSIELIKKQNSLRSSITRQKARKEKLQTELQNTSLRTQKLKLEAKIEKTSKKLINLESTLSFVLEKF
ncbi:hypothetical protein [Tenacibaculum halocynthiae]|uniref:hypothetical protein n=1 Tax=Tenacibaculum halocynthiae TaxID=1254437 RepID=UPI003D6571F8